MQIPLSKRLHDRFSVDATDHEGRLLLIQLWFDEVYHRTPPNEKRPSTDKVQLPEEMPLPPDIKSSDRHLHLIDLATGKSVVSHLLPEEYQFEQGTISLPGVWSTWGGANDEVFVHGALKLADGAQQDCVWLWNVISNQKQLLKDHQRGTLLFPSKDGRVLIEHLTIPLSPFQALIPGSFLGVSANGVMMDSWFAMSSNPSTGISLWKTWSLPEMKARATLFLPAFANRTPYCLSHDGRWLVLYDDFFDLVMNEEHTKSKEQLDIIKIYDMESGNLWCELHWPYGTLADANFTSNGFQSIFPVPLNVSPIESNVSAVRRSRRQPRLSSGMSMKQTEYQRFFHVPTKAWLPPTGGTGSSDSLYVPYGSEGAVRWMSEARLTNNRTTFYTTAANGQTTEAGFIDQKDWGFDVKLIPHSSQVVQQRHPRSTVKEWLGDYAYRYDWLRNLLDEGARQELVVFDYASHKTYWKLDVTRDSHVETTVTPTGSFLVVTQMMGDQHVLTVLQLPVRFWSGWWSASVGVAVAGLLRWQVLRRSK